MVVCFGVFISAVVVCCGDDILGEVVCADFVIGAIVCVRFGVWVFEQDCWCGVRCDRCSILCRIECDVVDL